MKSFLYLAFLVIGSVIAADLSPSIYIPKAPNIVIHPTTTAKTTTAAPAETTAAAPAPQYTSVKLDDSDTLASATVSCGSDALPSTAMARAIDGVQANCSTTYNRVEPGAAVLSSAVDGDNTADGVMAYVCNMGSIRMIVTPNFDTQALLNKMNCGANDGSLEVGGVWRYGYTSWDNTDFCG